jgi:NitT/TauT family transport system substrate-binding protein
MSSVQGRLARLAIVGFVAFGVSCGFAHAEAIKIGVVKVAANGPNFIAQEKGYFAAEGLEAEIVAFDSAEPIAVAVVSGAVDFGATGPGGALYNLAGQNAIRVISGLARESPGFPVFVFVVSNQAYQAGFKTFKDMAGHSGSVTQFGAPSHYAYAMLEAKYHIDPASVRVVPLQSLPNQVTGVTGGQVDSGVILATVTTPAINRGDVKLLGYVGDEIPIQTGVVFTAAKTANDRRPTVEKFLRAFRKAARDYHDAFIGPDEKRLDGPTAPEILAMIGKYVGQSPQQLKAGISYIDADATLDVQDILRQIAWFKAQGMIKTDVTGDQVIDKRYVIAKRER